MFATVNVEGYHLKCFNTGEKSWKRGEEVLKDGKKVFEKGKWITKSVFECVLINDSQSKIIITVPPGFESDGATGIPDWGNYWIIHDFLYKNKHVSFWSGWDMRIDKKNADKIGEILLDHEINQIQYNNLKKMLFMGKNILRPLYDIISKKYWVEDENDYLIIYPRR